MLKLHQIHLTNVVKQKKQKKKKKKRKRDWKERKEKEKWKWFRQVSCKQKVLPSKATYLAFERLNPLSYKNVTGKQNLVSQQSQVCWIDFFLFYFTFFHQNKHNSRLSFTLKTQM